MAYNHANFLRTLATPEAIERWSLTSLRERLIKTGARLVRHGRYAIFQIGQSRLGCGHCFGSEVAVPGSSASIRSAFRSGNSASEFPEPDVKPT